MGTNIDEIAPLTELAKKQRLYGISFQVLADMRVHFPLINEQMEEIPHGWYHNDPLWIKASQKATSVIQDLINKQKHGYPILNSKSQLKAMCRYYSRPESVKQSACLSGSNLCIGPYGKAHLCPGFGPIGNMFSDHPLKIWTSPKSIEIRHKIKHCQNMCRLLNNNF